MLVSNKMDVDDKNIKFKTFTLPKENGGLT
jgi:hypothetical protein